MARWSAKALLISAGVLLVGGAIWYARAATVPLIVAALVSTQVLPLIDWATGMSGTFAPMARSSRGPVRARARSDVESDSMNVPNRVS